MHKLGVHELPELVKRAAMIGLVAPPAGQERGQAGGNSQNPRKRSLQRPFCQFRKTPIWQRPTSTYRHMGRFFVFGPLACLTSAEYGTGSAVTAC